MIRGVLKFLARCIGALLALLLLSFLFLWLRFRLPIGDPITSIATVRYQMIDLGQGETESRSAIELITGNKRIFLASGPFPFIYASGQKVKEGWPESPFEMMKKGYTVQVTFRVRKLRFAPGYTPASQIQIQPIPGYPTITK